MTERTAPEETPAENTAGGVRPERVTRPEGVGLPERGTLPEGRRREGAALPEVAGSLWSVEPEQQVAAARRLQGAGLRRLHWDMSDGRFAAAGGFGAERAREIAEETGLAAEAHLMAVDPVAEVDAWSEFCDLVIVHAESEGWARAVDRIVRRGATPGLAVSPGTDLSSIPADIAVLCMAITPGQAGSAFDEGVLARVAALRTTSPTRPIGIDGGVQRRYAERAADAGADWLVVGTDLFTGDGAQRWKDLLRGGPDSSL